MRTITNLINPEKHIYVLFNNQALCRQFLAQAEWEGFADEAEVVRALFRMILDGASLGQLKDFLESNNIKTPEGKDVWSISVIRYMLTVRRLVECIQVCGNKKIIVTLKGGYQAEEELRKIEVA